MTDPLDDARLLVERANEQIVEFKTLLKAFIENEAYVLRADKNVGTGAYVHKLILTGQPGRRAKAVAREAWGNLRAALDHLNAACARLGGASRHDRRAHFPFAKDARSLPSAIRERCRNVPQAVTAYFASLRPHPEGDDRLFGLTKIRNTNEHWKLRSAIFQIMAAQVVWPNTSPYQKKIIEVSPAVSAVHEIELFVSDSPMRDYKVLLVVKIFFEDFEAFSNVTADDALEIQSRKVTEIIDKTEAILRREGLI